MNGDSDNPVAQINGAKFAGPTVLRKMAIAIMIIFVSMIGLCCMNAIIAFPPGLGIAFLGPDGTMTIRDGVFFRRDNITVTNASVVFQSRTTCSSPLQANSSSQTFMVITDTVTAIPTLPLYTITKTATASTTTITVSVYSHVPEITSVGACRDTKLNVLTPCTMTNEPTSTRVSSGAAPSKKNPLESTVERLQRLIRFLRRSVQRLRGTLEFYCSIILPRGAPSKISYADAVASIVLAGMTYYKIKRADTMMRLREGFYDVLMLLYARFVALQLLPRLR